MKKYLFFSIIINCTILSYQPVLAQHITIKQTNESGLYHSGQILQMFVFAHEPANDSITVTVRRNYQKQFERKKIAQIKDSLLILNEKTEGPSSIIVEVTTATVTLGSIIDAERYQPSTTRPDDMDIYWADQKKMLRALPFEIKKETVKSSVAGYDCYNVEINCISKNPARGYLAKPQMAQAHTLPIVLFVHGAGVSGNWCRSEPGNALRYAVMGKGALSFDLNAHGMLNGQPEEYYKDLENGLLKGYGQQGLEDRSTVYFLGMYLRLIRTLDYLTSLPEWDGKRILVIGESQGGGQALAAAGLYPAVTAVVATVPAMCDWGRFLKGGKGTWPYPFETKNNTDKMLTALPYYDAAHLLKGAKTTIVAEIGLIDVTCSAEAVYAALNQASGEKILLPVPYRAHHLTQLRYKEQWDKQVALPKDNFIRNFLK